MITFQDIQSAAIRLVGQAYRTPVVTSRTFDNLIGAKVFFKCENLQRAGAFKFRGAYNTIRQLSDDQRSRGVVTFSSGNHAQAVALVAKLLKMPAVIVMPNDAPEIKLKATRGYGAEVILYDRVEQKREAIAKQIAEERGMALVPPFDHPMVIAGQGTCGLEILEQVPNVGTVVVPVGGGGLLSGVAAAIKLTRPSVKVIGVEPAGAAKMSASLAAGLWDWLRKGTPGGWEKAEGTR